MYFETTMFNYYFDARRDGHDATVRIFEAVGNGEFEGYTSEYVTYELMRAESPKREMMLDLIDKYGIRKLDTNNEIIRLQNLYLQEGIIPYKFGLDGAHIALATVYRLDCVLSFNFKHINKLKTKKMTALINT